MHLCVLRFTPDTQYLVRVGQLLELGDPAVVTKEYRAADHCAMHLRAPHQPVLKKVQWRARTHAHGTT